MMLYMDNLQMLPGSFLVCVSFPASYFLTALTQLLGTPLVSQLWAISLIQHKKGKRWLSETFWQYYYFLENGCVNQIIYLIVKSAFSAVFSPIWDNSSGGISTCYWDDKQSIAILTQHKWTIFGQFNTFTDVLVHKTAGEPLLCYINLRYYF